jgi:hypothetical protein
VESGARHPFVGAALKPLARCPTGFARFTRPAGFLHETFKPVLDPEVRVDGKGENNGLTQIVPGGVEGGIPSFARPDNPDRMEVTQMSPTEIDTPETDPRVTEKAAMSHDGADPSAAVGEKHGHRGHSHWMMIACCVPMLLVAVFLLAGGVGLAALVPFLFCAAMMVVMMGVMSGGHRHR